MPQGDERDGEGAQAALQLRVEGRVQGVGYRAFAQRSGALLGLVGYVRNQPEGSVELLAEGPRADLESLLAECRRGPTGARVERVTVAWLTPTGLYSRFEIRR